MAVALRDTAISLAVLTHESRNQFRDRDREFSKKRSTCSIAYVERRDAAECGLDPLPCNPDPDAPPY